MAGPLAFSAPSSPSGGGGVQLDLGNVFTANTTFDVDALGTYVPAGGLNVPEEVGLYDSSGTLLSSATVSLADPEISGYLFQAITPIALTAGLQYTVVTFDDGNSWAYGPLPGQAPEVTFNFDDYDDTNVLAFTTSTGSENFGPAYFGPNFEIEEDTPEPGTLCLFGFAALPLIGHVLPRRTAAAV
jgi:hypothetical protein